jgi:hypothetical protein
MGEVGRLVPDVIAAVDHETPTAELADVRRNLGRLQSEQERLRERVRWMEQRLGATGAGGGGRP